MKDLMTFLNITSEGPILSQMVIELAMDENPSEEKINALRERFGNYITSILKHWGNVIKEADARRLDLIIKKKREAFEEAKKATEGSVLLTKGGNVPNSTPRNGKLNEDIQIIINDLSALKVKSSMKYEKNTIKGSRRAAENKTSMKHLIDCKVSKLRRILYWRNFSDSKAEEAIDVILEQAGIVGYQKSNRRPNYRYKEVLFK